MSSKEVINRNLESIESESDDEKTSSLNDKHLKKLDPDKFVESYGPYGKYQILTYVLAQSLNFFYSASIYIMSYVQLNLTKECLYKNETIPITQTCIIKDYPENVYDKMPNTTVLTGEVCGQYEDTILLTKEHTASTNLLVDFDLSCSHWVFQEFGLTVFTVGAVVAVPIMSMIADRYGRKPVIIYFAILAFIANIAAAFSPNYFVFLVLRTIIGAASDTYLSVASVVTCEYVAEKARSWITIVYNVAWASGMLWTLVVTFLTDDWRYRYLIVSAPGIYSFILICFLPESPHWLIIHNKTERLKKYIRTSNKINKDHPDFEECQADAHHEEKHESFKDLFGSTVMLWRLFGNGYIEFVISLVYFAISFLSVELESDHVTAFLFSSVIEIPAGCAVLPLMIYFGRKSIVFWCMLVQSISFFFLVIFLESYSIKFTLLLVGKVMATIIYSVHPIWANEQFPTSVRSLSFSLMNVPQSIGIIISPYIKHIKMEPDWIPFLVIGVLSCFATIATCFLEETKNTKMPKDVKSLSTQSSISNPSGFSTVFKFTTEENSPSPTLTSSRYSDSD